MSDNKPITVSVSDDVRQRAKAEAKRQGVDFRTVVEEGLRLFADGKFILKRETVIVDAKSGEAA